MAADSIDDCSLSSAEETSDGEDATMWEGWVPDADEEAEAGLLCLFCESSFDSAEALFDHCNSDHSFDFYGTRENLSLDFYGCFKLINYVRSQVEEKICWSCGLVFQCKKDLLSHLHPATNFQKDWKLPWENDAYLSPFMEDDALLHSFSIDEGEDECPVFDEAKCIEELMENGFMFELGTKNQGVLGIPSSELGVYHGNGELVADEGMTIEHMCVANDSRRSSQMQTDQQLRISFAKAAAREIKKVNDSYFGSYGSYGIHREMISDKVRMDAYRGAILNNPALMNQANVMDVGCGTGILSLFAAQSGASKVIAVEASEKMAAMATQIVKDNGLLAEINQTSEEPHSGVITVIHSMVEELDKLLKLPANSIDVLVSEWMGYCLLYESMLGSVLYARDHWLKPGGTILPDTATMFAAGFGRGGTSLPFWENVYGFDMSCIGKEVLVDSARIPIVDVIDSRDILTDEVVLKSFDLTTMKPDEMNFTSSIELKLKTYPHEETLDVNQLSWCHGICLWFETAFTSRFCKEAPTILSTSPHGPSTHWCQTIFTFQEPIAIASAACVADTSAAVGSKGCPATGLKCRISIAQSTLHRSIDISLETTGICMDGRKHNWPVQFFNL